MEKPKVLIVDDDPVSTVIAKSLLKKIYLLGEIMIANNGKEAIEIMKDNTFKFIFLDLKMPVMNGFEFLNYFFSLNGSSGAEIIINTSTDNSRDLKRLSNYKVFSIILKPYTVSKFKELQNLFELHIHGNIMANRFKTE